MALHLKSERVEEYLSGVYKKAVTVTAVTPLVSGSPDELKGFGYGVPYLIEFTLGAETKRVVLETMRPEGFGHDHFADRAGILLWQHSAFNKLPKHVRSVDVGSFVGDCETLRSLGDCCEFFLLTEFAEGQLYHVDLDRIRLSGGMLDLDEERCVALAEYLGEIHSVKHSEPGLYYRRIRDLVGHGEGIFGLTDSYPGNLGYVDSKYFVDFEKACVEWRWRLKAKAKRLSQVHGDFHPWNIMFTKGTDFMVLDRSRGEWGEPADDIAALTINYLFYSLQTYGTFAGGAFQRLWSLFWKNYLDKTGDEEILNVIQPFYAWRSIVIASPLWYPNLPLDVRKKIFRFATRVLKAKVFEYETADLYLK